MFNIEVFTQLLSEYGLPTTLTFLFILLLRERFLTYFIFFFFIAPIV